MTSEHGKTNPGEELPASTSTWRWWLLPLIWMGVIFFLSAQPDFDFAPDLWTTDPFSLAAHFLEYGVLAALFWLAAHRTEGLGRRATWIAFGLAVAYALTDEFHQSFVPGRVPDVRDLLADAVGAALVLWLLARMERGLAARKRNHSLREPGDPGTMG
jgi:VanZ family protein